MEEQNLKGKRVIITGANSGIGFETAKKLANKGAQVILAVRDTEKGIKTINDLKADNPNISVQMMLLDLADLKKVRDFAESFYTQFDSLDILINNAGVMIPPYSKTKDGFELQFGGNHLGHFALTGLLLPLLKKTINSRVVTVSSLAHKGASINFDNLDGSRGYGAMKFYGQSKLANLLFSKELDNRLKKNGIKTLSIACHPGISATNLFRMGGKLFKPLVTILVNKLTQPATMGALPTIYAATDASLVGGEYIGPDGKGNRKGNPAIEYPASGVYNENTMKRLWDISEQLTGVHFDFSS
ncbi:MAG: short-chain dehydrogenase [Bacillales bacterium]|jgi:NAD(P)-dependent dehydrogenase (short-subunit alcohol dehydrogenase family)|nr:short-chain dehydrogenase [Bacillales bacterium]